MLAICSLVPLPFPNLVEHLEIHSSHTVEAWLGEFWAFLCKCVRWVQLCSSLSILALPFFEIGMKTDLFQSCGHCWVFQICWHIECSTFTASSFKIWNSSTGIPSPPLALFVVMLPKAGLISHSRMSPCSVFLYIIYTCSYTEDSQQDGMSCTKQTKNSPLPLGIQ